MSQISFTSHSVTREAAARLIAASIAACERIGFEPVVAIVDGAGNLKAFERSDKNSFLAVNIAIDKAYTAAYFGLSTAQWVDLLDDRAASNLRHAPASWPRRRFSDHGGRRDHRWPWHFRRQLGAGPGSRRGSPSQFRPVAPSDKSKRLNKAIG
jgi:hypothetical protein